MWRPGQTKGIDPATEKYTYTIDPTKPLAVKTETLVDPGNGAALSYKTRVVLYDAFGAIRQAQADAVGGGRVVTDNFNDSHGWSVRAYDHWYTTGAPETQLIGTNISGVEDWKTVTYDGTGRPTLVTGRSGAETTPAISSSRTVYGGDRTTVIPPTGGVTATTISNGRGEEIEYQQYSVAPTVTGNVVTGGTAKRMTYTYDGIGQQLTQKSAVGVVGKEATWTNTYDLLGRVTTAVSPDSGTTTTTFFDTGEIKSRTDGANRTVTYDYDALGRPLHRYDNAGVELASWTYDTLMIGRPTASTSIENGTSYTKSMTGYTAAGEPQGTTVGLNVAGFKTTYTTTQSWTSTHLLASTTLADSSSTAGGLAAETLNYTYDNLGTPKSMAGNNTYVSDAVYTPYGEPSRYTLGVNDQTTVITYARNPKTRQVTDVTLTGQTANPQIEKLSYTYDKAGNITRLVNTQGGGTAAPVQTQCFAYDTQRQLVDAWASTDACATNPTTLGNNSKVGGPQPYWTTWKYDDAGNRTSQVKHGMGTAANTTTTSTMSTTKPHSLVSTATTGATTATTAYTYNADGAMATRKIGTATTTFSYDPDGSLDTIATPSWQHWRRLT